MYPSLKPVVKHYQLRYSPPRCDKPRASVVKQPRLQHDAFIDQFNTDSAILELYHEDSGSILIRYLIYFGTNIVHY